jgi:hypothetical protein
MTTRTKIELGRQGNFFFACLLIYFVFFGYICNIYQRNVGERLLFLYQVFFDLSSILSLVILFAIIFFMTFREKFYEYGLRNSIWMIPLVIIMSWFWYWVVYGFNIVVIAIYFTRIEGYITILTLAGVIILSAILGAYTKTRWENYRQKN